MTDSYYEHIMNQDYLSTKNKQQEEAIVCFQVWLCIQKKQINETKRHRERHCGVLKHMEGISIDE